VQSLAHQFDRKESILNKLLSVLLLISMPAWAEWTLVGGADGAKFSTYADFATIRQRSSMAEMWTLVDFKNAQRAPYGPEYLSLKVQQEFDCGKNRSRVLFSESHTGQMGEEDVVSTHAGPDEWEVVAASSIAEELWKVACK
jgi:hypothetical protein